MYQTDFTPEEFRERRKKLCEMVEDNALLLIQGARSAGSSTSFRQDNDFYYLSGIEVPHSYLLINGRDASTTLFIPHEAQVGREEEGEILCAENADYVTKLTGIDQVAPVEALSQRIAGAGLIYTPFDEGQGACISDDNTRGQYRKILADPWDGMLNRPCHFIKLLRERIVGVEIRDLTGPIGELRSIKSPKEIELLRRAGELTAIGVREAMRSTQPGVMEYQLDAVMRYHFLAGGARDQAYIPICASGPNIIYGHYHINSRELTDWVLVDCAPDYHYYCSDIGRMWPINGKYTDAQRAIYGYVVEYHKALLQEVRAGRTAGEVREATDERMRPILEKWKFYDPIHKEAAYNLHSQISHGVGMCVHDRGHHFQGALKVGQVISLDPSVSHRAPRFYCRIEDTVVITEDGCENFTGHAPIDLDDVEALMKEDGLLQAFPEAFRGA